MKTLIYFSLNTKRLESFYNNNKKEEGKYDFRIYKEQDAKDNFKYISDLEHMLDNLDALSLLSTYVIIDYLSLFLKKNGENIETDDENLYKSIEAIRKIIVKYPEVFFLFDDTCLNAGKCFLLLLGESESTLIKYHSYRQNSEAYKAIDRNFSNFFDGTKLRYLLKRQIYDHLKVSKYNFSLIQESRANNLALSVEEETAQNKFNSYCLYSNGFRVWPVLSAEELKDCGNSEGIKQEIKLVLRDYDLQFASTGGDINSIRGYTYDDNKKEWSCLLDNSDYWKILKDKPIFFVTKGRNALKLYDKDYKENNQKTTKVLRLSGIHKPITGIYYQFKNFNCFKVRQKESLSLYKTTLRKQKIADVAQQHFIKDQKIPKYSEYKEFIWNLYYEEEINKRNDKEISKIQTYCIDTTRENHDHGVSLDIYAVVSDMLKRARYYYEKEKFIRAAVVAWEAIEVMNGFHEALMLKAYKIYAVSENAAIMKVLGGDEDALCEDANMRVKKIKSDVKRLVFRRRRERGDEASALPANILKQIFSECREFCRKEKHFESEEVFIRAMACIDNPWFIEKIGLKEIFKEPFYRLWFFLKKWLNDFKKKVIDGTA